MTGGWSTPHGERLELGETFVQGKDAETARILLEAAEALGLDALVVRTTNHGFKVPAAVWDRAQQDHQATPGQDF